MPPIVPSFDLDELLAAAAEPESAPEKKPYTGKKRGRKPGQKDVKPRHPRGKSAEQIRKERHARSGDKGVAGRASMAAQRAAKKAEEEEARRLAAEAAEAAGTPIVPEPAPVKRPPGRPRKDGLPPGSVSKNGAPAKSPNRRKAIIHETPKQLTQEEIEEARESFPAFVKTCWQGPGPYEPKWYHLHLAQWLDDLAKGNLHRLCVSMPPQHGKSQLCSIYFPAFMLGLYPDFRIISASFNKETATEFSRKVQDVMDSAAYKAIFPNTQLAATKGEGAKRTECHFEVVGHHGRYRAQGASRGSGWTADIYLVDDPLGGSHDAHSKAIRDAQWQWFSEDVLTRGHKEAGVLIIMNRRHPEDMVGKLRKFEQQAEDKAKRNGKARAKSWKFVTIKAIREENDEVLPGDPRKIGDPLWPERHSLEDLEEQQMLNPWTFQALFQQNPNPDGGCLFKIQHFNRWQILPSMDGTWLSSWDCNAGGTGNQRSCTVGQIWYRPYSSSRMYLVDQYKGQPEFNDLLNDFKLMIGRYPKCKKHIIEDKGWGASLISALKDTVGGLVSEIPKGSKRDRAEVTLAQASAGNIWIPDDVVTDPNTGQKKDVTWVMEWLVNVTMFTGADREKNDEVDTMTQAERYFPQSGVVNYTFDVLEKSRSSSFRL